MSGMTRSTPRSSDSGNIMPASMTMMSSPSRNTSMFMPNSPSPPRGMAVRDCGDLPAVLPGVLLKEESTPHPKRPSYHTTAAGTGTANRRLPTSGVRPAPGRLQSFSSNLRTGNSSAFESALTWRYRGDASRGSFGASYDQTLRPPASTRTPKFSLLPNTNVQKQKSAAMIIPADRKELVFVAVSKEMGDGDENHRAERRR